MCPKKIVRQFEHVNIAGMIVGREMPMPRVSHLIGDQHAEPQRESPRGCAHGHAANHDNKHIPEFIRRLMVKQWNKFRGVKHVL